MATSATVDLNHCCSEEWKKRCDQTLGRMEAERRTVKKRRRWGGVGAYKKVKMMKEDLFRETETVHE